MPAIAVSATPAEPANAFNPAGIFARYLTDPLKKPIPFERPPIAFTKPPMTDTPPPNNFNAGPKAAAINPQLMMFCCCSVDNELNFLAKSARLFIQGLTASRPLLRALISGPPTSIAISVS